MQQATETRTALVTGAHRGLGLEACRQLGHLGWRVWLTDADAAAGQRACDTLRAQGLDIHFEPLDVTQEESLDTLAGRLERGGIRLSALINNAGVAMEGFNAHVAEHTVAVNFLRHRAVVAPHGGARAHRHGVQQSGLAAGLSALAPSALRPATCSSTPSARVGCEPTWADPMPRAASSGARTSSSGRPRSPPGAHRRTLLQPQTHSLVATEPGALDGMRHDGAAQTFLDSMVFNNEPLIHVIHGLEERR